MISSKYKQLKILIIILPRFILLFCCIVHYEGILKPFGFDTGHSKPSLIP